MTRQSISFTNPNTEWLNQKVKVEGEYRSNSDATNAAIRRMREVEAESDLIRAKLIAAEQSVKAHGWVKETQKEMLDGFKAKALLNGKL